MNAHDEALIIERVRCSCGSDVFEVARAEMWIRLTCSRCKKEQTLQGQTYRSTDDIPF